MTRSLEAKDHMSERMLYCDNLACEKFDESTIIVHRGMYVCSECGLEHGPVAVCSRIQERHTQVPAIYGVEWETMWDTKARRDGKYRERE